MKKPLSTVRDLPQNLLSRGSEFLRYGLSLFAIYSAFFLWNGCGPRERRVDHAVKSGILLLGNGTEPEDLDPHTVTGVPENNVISSLFEGLISYHPTDDLKPESGVAESWYSNEDKSQWTFNLRQNAAWSNGDPVTAHDFVFSFQRILSPALAAEYAESLYVLVNAMEFHQGMIDDFSKVGVTALDDYTLEVSLIGPEEGFLGFLKHYSWYPVHPGTILKYGKMDERSTKWTSVERMVSNGPFQLKKWVVNSIIEVSKSPTYWDRDRVRLNEIHFYPIDVDSVEESMFLAGQIHLTNTVPISKIRFHKNKNPEWLHIDPYLGIYFYRFNVTNEKLRDVRIRQALCYAIDRDRIVKHVTLGEQRPASGLTPDGFPGYAPMQPYGFDLARAQALLTESGYPDGSGFPELEILINTDEGHRKIAEVIQEMWRNNLNINVTIHNQEWKVYLNSQSNLEYEVCRAGWIADYVSPMTFVDIWTTGNGNNDTGWSHPEFDRLVALAKRARSNKERLLLLQKAETLMMNEAPIMPIYWYTRVYLKDPRIQGWNPKLLDNRPYKYIYFN